MSTSGRKTVKGVTTSAPKRVKAKAATVASSAVTRTVPTQDEIARRAYELYLERGGEHGHDVEDWQRAEAELLSL